MSKTVLSVLVIVLLMIVSTRCSHSLWNCPNVEPLPDFRMQEFLGFWYVIQTTCELTPCLTYSLIAGYQKGLYHITEIGQESSLIFGPQEHRTTANLTIPYHAVPARMNLARSSDLTTTTFTVFMTDYKNYAAVLTCKNCVVFYKWCVKILARTPDIDKDLVEQILKKLSRYNIDPFALSIISHKGCGPISAPGSVVSAAQIKEIAKLFG